MGKKLGFDAEAVKTVLEDDKMRVYDAVLAANGILYDLRHDTVTAETRKKAKAVADYLISHSSGVVKMAKRIKELEEK